MPWPPAPITDREIIARYLPKHLRTLADEGEHEAVRRLVEALRGCIVAAIRTYREGSGDGVWSELDNGRLIDGLGYPATGTRGGDGASVNPQ